MNIKKEIIVEQPIHKVWEVLGDQYGQAYKWASGLDHSEALGLAKIEGAPCSQRSCQTNFGQITESVRKYEPSSYELEYEVIKGFPSFIDTAINNWQLQPAGKGTKVFIDFKMKTKGFLGLFMGPLMKMQMNKVITNVLDDFKQYVETGKPSARKAKEIATLLKKAA
ncbi:MAG: SRPBCC family protein [Saprospiraceae bacterium]|nr:SRPBCC family protein [Saprospiraceae bacterium]